MLSFIPSIKLEKELKILHELVVSTNKLVENISFNEARYLNRFALISNVGASTRIENAALTDNEIEWMDTTLRKDDTITAFEGKKKIIIDKLLKDRERSVEEVVGCRQVLSLIYIQTKEFFPLSEVIIRGLHYDLLKYYSAAKIYAGNYKKSPNQVISFNHETNEKQIVLDPAPPGTITETAMYDLIKWYNNMIHEHPWPILIATEFMFRFLAIHPFQDGNGRLGRALFILALLQSDDRHLSNIARYIAVDRHIEQNRALYYSVLHQCANGKFKADSSNYKLEPLVWFFIKIIKSALNDIPVYINRYKDFQALSESAVQVLNCFKDHPEKRLQIAKIVSQVDLPRRTIQYSLKKLCDQQFIQRLGKGAGTRYQLIF